MQIMTIVEIESWLKALILLSEDEAEHKDTIWKTFVKAASRTNLGCNP